MSNPEASIYKVPEGVGNSLADLRERLAGLQPALSSLMSKSMELFDVVYPQAPHPADIEDPKVYAVGTVNYCPVESVPMGRELTVVLGAGKWVRIFRNTDSSPDVYPRQHFWFTQIEDDVDRKVIVSRSHNPSRVGIEFDVETVDYDTNGMCVGFVNGASYYGQEPYIAEADAAVDAARQITQDLGYYPG